MMSEQHAKAQARLSAKMAPKPDPEAAARAINDARIKTKRLAAQKLTATLTSGAPIAAAHHPKDRVISEFDDPDAHKVV